MQLKKTRWSKYNINYHFAWIPKYRRKVLTGDVAEFLKEIFNEIAEGSGVEIKALSVQPDHVHLFVSAPPRYSPAELVNLFKGVSARRLLEKFSHLRTKHGFWAKTYFVGTAGTVSEETIRRYIEECQDI